MWYILEPVQASLKAEPVQMELLDELMQINTVTPGIQVRLELAPNHVVEVLKQELLLVEEVMG